MFLLRFLCCCITGSPLLVFAYTSVTRYHTVVAEYALQRHGPAHAFAHYHPLSTTQDPELLARISTLGLVSGALKPASTVATRWAHATPTDEKAHLICSILHTKLQEATAAETHIAQLLTRSPDPHRAAQDYLEALEPEERAYGTIRMASAGKRLSDRQFYPVFLAQTALDRDNPQEAYRLLAPHIAHPPHLESAALLWIQILAALDDPRGSTECHRILQSHPGWDYLHAECLSEAPPNPQNWEVLLTRTLDPETWLNLGQHAAEHGQSTLAEAAWKKAAASAAYAPIAAYFLGTLKAELQDLAGAQKCFAEILDGPLHTAAQIQSAELQAEQGHYEDALWILDTTFPPDPGSEKMLVLSQLDLCLRMGLHAQTQAYADRARQRWPDDPEVEAAHLRAIAATRTPARPLKTAKLPKHHG